MHNNSHFVWTSYQINVHFEFPKLIIHYLRIVNDNVQPIELRDGRLKRFFVLHVIRNIAVTKVNAILSVFLAQLFGGIVAGVRVQIANRNLYIYIYYRESFVTNVITNIFEQKIKFLHLTLAPCFSSSSQNARPRPVAPPVTSATLPLISIIPCKIKYCNKTCYILSNNKSCLCVLSKNN